MVFEVVNVLKILERDSKEFEESDMLNLDEVELVVNMYDKLLYGIE